MNYTKEIVSGMDPEEIAELLNVCQMSIHSQRHEIVSMKMEVEALKDIIDDMEDEMEDT